MLSECIMKGKVYRCYICGLIIPNDYSCYPMIRNGCCGHSYDYKCLKKHYEKLIKKGSYNFWCMNYHCGEKIPLGEIKWLISRASVDLLRKNVIKNDGNITCISGFVRKKEIKSQGSVN